MKNSKSSIWEMNNSAFETPNIGLSFCFGEPLSSRSPFLQNFSFFSDTAAARRLVVTTSCYWFCTHKAGVYNDSGLLSHAASISEKNVFCHKVNFQENPFLTRET